MYLLLWWTTLDDSIGGCTRRPYQKATFNQKAITEGHTKRPFQKATFSQKASKRRSLSLSPEAGRSHQRQTPLEADPPGKNMAPDRKWHHAPVNRMTDRRLWKHYLPLRSVMKNAAENKKIFQLKANYSPANRSVGKSSAKVTSLNRLGGGSK